MLGRATGWIPDIESGEDYTLSTDKIQTLIKQIEASKGIISFLDLIGEKGCIKDEQIINILKIQVEGFLETYLSNIDLVPATFDELDQSNNDLPIEISSPFPEEVTEFFFKTIGLEEDWYLIKSQNASEGTDLKDQRICENLKNKLQAAVPQIAPVGAFFNFSDKEFRLFLDFVRQGDIEKEGSQDFNEKLLENYLSKSIDEKNPLSVFRFLNQCSPENNLVDFKQVILNFLRSSKGKLANLKTYDEDARILREQLTDLNLEITIKSLNLEAKNLNPEKGECQQTLRARLEALSDIRKEPDPVIQIPLTYELANQLKAKADKGLAFKLPRAVDLSYWCSPVKNQGNINACTVNAVASLVEYFEKKSTGKTHEVSRRFLYKVTRRIAVDRNNHYLDNFTAEELDFFAAEGRKEDLRNLIEEIKSSEHPVPESRFQGLIKDDEEVKTEFSRRLFDIGASIRHTLKALQLFGIPPERHWEYVENYPDVDKEPLAFCYSFAQNYQALKYFRLDLPDHQDKKTALERPDQSIAEAEDKKPEQDRQTLILTQIKAVLAAGFPCIFGFPIDLQETDKGWQPREEQIDSKTGEIKFLGQKWAEDLKAKLKRKDHKTVLHGHAALAVGYDDARRAFLIQNSWGIEWGKWGYGWLSYDYVYHKLATNWWSLINLEWVETGQFGLGENLGAPDDGIQKPSG